MTHSPAPFSRVRAFIFDLDGTLVDSKLDLANSVNATLARFGRAPLAQETIFGFIGNGAGVLVRRALGHGATDAECSEALVYFLASYREHMLDHTRAYPGVREGLELLAGHPLAVLTNKPVNFSLGILEGLGLAGFFRVVYGGNSFEKKKPDPYGVQVILRDLAVESSETMMVGDSDVDVMTARNAGISVAGVSYGIGSHTFVDCPPDLIVDSLVELPARLNGKAA